MVTKERANVRAHLRSERGDPLLAAHDFGLGRVVVLPGGLGRYASTWPAWTAWGPFVGGLTEWVSNRFGDSRVHVDVSEVRGQAHLEIDALSADGDWQTIDAASVRLSDPFGRITILQAQAYAPGNYRVELPLRHTGRHRVSVQAGDVSLQHDFSTQPRPNSA